MKQEETSKQKPRFGSVILSILAAAIGVQSDKNRERDFANGSPFTFIIGGFVFHDTIHSHCGSSRRLGS